MDLAFKFCLILTIISISSTVSAQGDTCSACNCQFNNVKVLMQLIESKIATAWANESVSGVTFTRWGKTSCPTSTGAQLVYSGRVGGTYYGSQGGAAEKICLPDDPEYSAATSGVSVSLYSIIQGTEYELFSGPNANVAQYSVPCAVCDVPTRARAIVVPAKFSCPSGWIREYYGYLTTERESHYRSSYTCIDNSPDVIAGTGGNEDSSLLYYTFTDCNGLSCPPYERNRILSCVVCTK